MNSEYTLNSARSAPRIQQPRRPLSPLEYAAAGDAPRGQISLDPNLGTSIRTFAMDTSLLSTTIKDADSNSKSRFNDSCTYPNAGRVFNRSNEPLENVLSVIDKKSSSIRCRSSSKQRKIKDHSDYCGSLEKEPPSKECAHDILMSDNYENLSENELKNLSKRIGPSNKSDMRNSTEDYSVDNIVSPNRKVSMFSAEIWTEKVLPIDTFVCPEPELVEIYFDKKKTNDELNRFRDYSSESIDVSAIWKSSNRDALGRNHLPSPPLSAKKSRTSASGQKTVNFDDEIWPVCPKLIPSGKELSDLSIFGNRYETIPPEKLNKNGEEIAAAFHPQTIILRSASIFGVPSRASTDQYDLDDSAKSERAIEPTHETEEQIDFRSIRSQAEKYCENNSRTETSRATSSAVEKVQSFNYVDRISRRESPAMNVLTQIGDTDRQKIPKTTERLENVCSSSQEKRTLGKESLSKSKSESVSRMIGDAQHRRTNSLFGAEMPVIGRKEIHSSTKIGVKRKREGLGTSTVSTTNKQIVSSPIEDNDFIYDRSENIVPTPTGIVCASFCKVDDLSEPSVLESQYKIRGKSVESASRNRGACHQIRVEEGRVKLSDWKSSSKLPATEVRQAYKSVVAQETKKNPKCVKMVRFKTCDRQSSVKINRSGTELQTETLEDQGTDAYQSKMHLQLNSYNVSHTPDSMSVDSFEQGIDQLVSQSTKRIERDPTSNDAVETLAKVEIIVEANRQAAERLQKLQPHVVIPRLIPQDAGKSIAKALMRCRNYMQTNGYSRDATSTLNKLLMSTVMSLKESVNRQKLALAQEKRQAISEGRHQPKQIHQANLLNSTGVLTTDNLTGNQVQYLIADILKVTKTIVPTLNEKETQRKSSVVRNWSNPGVKNVAGNIRTPVDTISSKTGTTNLTEVSKGRVEASEKKVTHLSVAQPNKVKEAVRKCSEKPTASTLHSEPTSNRNRGNHRVDKDSSISASTYPKKISSTDPTKTLKKMVNELWDKRSKTLPRYSLANDSTNNLHSLAGLNNASTNHKLPVWKPGGSNFNHPSMSAITNIQKIRPALTSSAVRKKNTTIEHLRNTTLHARTKAISGITKDTSKILEKSITKSAHNTSSQAKIRTVVTKGHLSEVSLDSSEVQVDETRSRKPRSKSRTRTKTPNKITRLTVTEIPLEHAEDTATLVREKIPAAKELPLSRKPSSSPKDIILMLEELIKSSGNETSIQNAHPVQIDAPHGVVIEDVNEEIDRIASTKAEVKPMNLTDLIPANEKDDQTIHQNQSIYIRSVEEIPKKRTSTVEIDDKENLCHKQTPPLQDTVTEPSYVHPEIHQTVAANGEEVFTVARSNSETQNSSDGCIGKQRTPSVSIVGYIADSSSDIFIGSVSSKCCQASLTSSTSYDVSEELISSQIPYTGTNPFCEGSRKSSNESLDSGEDGKVTRDNFSEQLQEHQSTSASSDTTMKKKFVNRHAKSLEMLREILSDQGLGIHFLSRAENEVRDRCKGGSNKKWLTAKRSSQGANLTATTDEKNDSTTQFGRLATLPELGNNFEHAEIATMTSENNSTTPSGEFDFHCSKVDKALLIKVVTVENATQFDITSKCDMCIGDGVICELSAPSVLQCKNMSAENISAADTSPPNFDFTNVSPNVVESESMEYRLPDDVLNAFQLAADKAANLYSAVNIFRANVGSERTVQSNSAEKIDFNQIPQQGTTKGPLSCAIDRSIDIGRSSKALQNLQKTENRNTVSPTTIIIPRTLKRLNEEPKFRELMNKTSFDSARNEITGKSVTSVKQAIGHTICDKLQNNYHPNTDHRDKPLVPPKPLFANRKAVGTTVENQKIQEEQSTDPIPALTLKNKSSDTITDHPSTIHSSLSSKQQNLLEGSVTGKRVEILHFAKRQIAPVVGSNSNTGSEDTIVQSHSIEPSIASLKSGKVQSKNGDVFTGSRIRTLLQKNLQRIKTEYDPMIDEQVFKDFRDRLLPEAFDDKVLFDKVFTETTTATFNPDMDDHNILSEVESLVNCLLIGVEEHSESTAVGTVCDPNPQSSRFRRIRKPVRRLKAERTKRIIEHGKRPIRCRKYWSILCQIIVSREHILSLVYAVICSFVFCCLQFSVHCEV